MAFRNLHGGPANRHGAVIVGVMGDGTTADRAEEVVDQVERAIARDIGPGIPGELSPKNCEVCHK